MKMGGILILLILIGGIGYVLGFGIYTVYKPMGYDCLTNRDHQQVITGFGRSSWAFDGTITNIYIPFSTKDYYSDLCTLTGNEYSCTWTHMPTTTGTGIGMSGGMATCG